MVIIRKLQRILIKSTICNFSSDFIRVTKTWLIQLANKFLNETNHPIILIDQDKNNIIHSNRLIEKKIDKFKIKYR